VQQHGWPSRRSGLTYLLGFGLALATAEIVLIAGHVVLGMTLHAALLLVATAQFALAREPARESIIAALLPLTRLVSLAVPTGEIDHSLAYALVSGPLLIAALLVAREVAPRMLATELGRPRTPWTQVRLAGLGLPMGLLLLQAAEGAPAGPAAAQFSLIAVVLVTALFEEVLFRGLLQHVVAARSPLLSLLLPNALYATMYLGSGSPAVVAAMASIGLILSICVLRTGSLWGVSAAHAIARLIAGFA